MSTAEVLFNFLDGLLEDQQIITSKRITCGSTTCERIGCELDEFTWHSSTGNVLPIPIWLKDRICVEIVCLWVNQEIANPDKLPASVGETVHMFVDEFVCKKMGTGKGEFSSVN